MSNTFIGTQTSRASSFKASEDISVRLGDNGLPLVKTITTDCAPSLTSLSSDLAASNAYEVIVVPFFPSKPAKISSFICSSLKVCWIFIPQSKYVASLSLHW